MSILGAIWAAMQKLVGRRTLYEIIAIALIIGYYEGVPGAAWIGNNVPLVGNYLYLIEGRVPRAYYQGVNEEKARNEAARKKWEEDKKKELDTVSKSYAEQITALRANSIQLTSVLEDTRKDLEDEKAKHDASGDNKPYCPPAVPSRVRDYLNAIR